MLMRFASGEIDGVECLEELGQKGAGMTSAAMFGIMGRLSDRFVQLSAQ